MASKSPGCSTPANSSCLSRGRECLLCGAKDTQMMQYSNTKIEVKTFLLQHFDGIILADDWICRKHVLEAQRHYSVPGFTPKWCNKLSQQQPSKEKCSNPSCTNTQYPKLIKPAFDKIKSTWNSQEAAGKSSPFALCHTCYCQAYNMLHPKKICRSCGAIPKAGISFSRHSPNAAIVTEHLKKTDYDILISPQDVLCFSCYKLHCSILKSLNSSTDYEGSDSGLQQNIKTWKNTVDSTDLLTSAVLSAVLFVAENLIQ